MNSRIYPIGRGLVAKLASDFIDATSCTASALAMAVTAPKPIVAGHLTCFHGDKNNENLRLIAGEEYHKLYALVPEHAPGEVIHIVGQGMWFPTNFDGILVIGDNQPEAFWMKTTSDKSVLPYEDLVAKLLARADELDIHTVTVPPLRKYSLPMALARETVEGLLMYLSKHPTPKVHEVTLVANGSAVLARALQRELSLQGPTLAAQPRQP